MVYSDNRKGGTTAPPRGPDALSIIAAMRDWYAHLATGRELPVGAASALDEQGFAILPGPALPSAHWLSNAYDAAFASAPGEDIRVGTTTTRLSDPAGFGRLFDVLVAFPPLLEACCRVIGRPFKLSSFLGRTLRAGSPSQELHVDVGRESADWPLLGFVLMVDDFRDDNGATRVVPGSQRLTETPESAMPDVFADHPKQQLACGPAGSLMVFNGSTWHGHTANRSARPRRSIQGAFIPREGQAATDFAVRLPAEVRARLNALGRAVLAL